MAVHAIRIRPCNAAAPAPRGGYVLYWMVAHRRTRFSFALDRAAEWGKELGKPVLVFEGLRAGYPWASDRLHRFAMDGMRDNAARLAETRALYFGYVEPQPGAGKGLLAALAEHAAVVITDDWPCFFLPRMVAAAAKQVAVRMEAVDSCGLLPLRATERVFERAFDFRRFLQKVLPEHLEHFPCEDPLGDLDAPACSQLPSGIRHRWPAAPASWLESDDVPPALPIDHDVPVVPEVRGGAKAGERQLTDFLQRLDRYAEQRNDPDADAGSGLSPWLHWGHLSPHEVLAAIARREDWTPDRIASHTRGARAGWWNLSPAAEAFLDELVTWRELGFNRTAHQGDYDRYESLPAWARATLRQHESDPRDPVYDLDAFERAATHDPLWNAAQNQLRREGRIHNYLRMLWGKKVLEWSESPRTALRILLHLNNKYGLDGRDPNSYSGIFWVFGRYDRPWPERPIFGKVRSMTSASTRKKVQVARYLGTYASDQAG